jgi:probable F420-dependent oxidoreductase
MVISKPKFGVVLPIIDIGGAPERLRGFAKLAEDIGYHHLAVPDHVLGVNVENRPDWETGRNTSDDYFHDPFVLFGFLAACTKTIEFSTQVMILPQRQTALVAKQAASLDVLSEGRFRFGIGIGWNEVEYQALNESFTNRGRRSEEQVQLMKALWAERHVTFEGKWHSVDDAGLNPLPTDRYIPIWFGGHADIILRRIAKWGDGWIMLAYPPGERAVAEFSKLKRYAEEEGRNPNDIGIEIWTSTASDDPDVWKREIESWLELGVTHITLNNVYGRGHHKRIAATSLSAHTEAIARYWEVARSFLS